MYSQFRVQNFRGFKDLELKDLARVNLIAGKNNVGKTSLLEAIAVYLGRYDVLLSRLPDGFYNDIWFQGRIAVENIFNWSLFFHQFDTQQNIFIETDNTLEKMTIAHIPSGKIPDTNRLLRYFGEGSIRYGEDALSLTIHEDVHYILQMLFWDDSALEAKNYVVYDNKGSRKGLIFLNARQYIDKNRLYGLFSEMRKSRQISELINVLKIFDEKVETIELLENGLYVDNGLPELIPLRNMGDGAIRAIEMVLAMSVLREGILIIDEIENGLHYSIQTDVWKAIAKAAELFNVQIFATTHSFEMIRAAHEAFSQSKDYNFAYHRLYRSQKTGEIDVVTYQRDNMESALDMSLEMR